VISEKLKGYVFVKPNWDRLVYMVAFAVVPSKVALINVDMQNCFVENSPIAAPDGLDVMDHVNRLIKAYRSAGVLILHTSHGCVQMAATSAL